MEVDTDNDVLLKLNSLRLALKELLKPEVLSKFTDLLEEIGGRRSFVERYDYFSKNSENGKDCRYARMAKQYFMEENEENVVNLVTWLYENWAKLCKKEQ